MFMHPSERAFAEAMRERLLANPFDRAETDRLERIALAIDLPAEVMNVGIPEVRDDQGDLVGVGRTTSEHPDFAALVHRAECLEELARQRLSAGKRASDQDSTLYRDLVLFNLYFRYRHDLQASIDYALKKNDPDAETRPSRPRSFRISYYDRFAAELERFFRSTPWHSDPNCSPAVRLALCYQIRRAFYFIHVKIRGRSRVSERLRAAVWQSIFTCNLMRYDHHMYDRMHDITTLITGPSGTGKDLVAEAIGQSRYIRVDPHKKAFTESVDGAFHPVNLSAIPSELIEAELFGNCKGAFTGAINDRVGWLELCGQYHSVFLDEIGELSESIQVKLLRVLQNRTFQRVGETAPRRFEGKFIAATNRDLDEEMRLGRFRRDFYYRLCSDRICTPTLREQLHDNPEELRYFVDIIARRLFGNAAESVAKEVVQWIERNLPKDYAWPGNIRELEQCIRNVVVRKEYHPPRDFGIEPVDRFTAKLKGMKLTADELLSWYCTLVFAETGNYSETARRLNIDRRTVQSKIDDRWLAKHEAEEIAKPS
jgi:transcriptional regulator with AAA-type ATPase domain